MALVCPHFLRYRMETIFPYDSNMNITSDGWQLSTHILCFYHYDNTIVLSLLGVNTWKGNAICGY